MKRRTQRRGVDLGAFGWRPTFLTDGVYAAVFALVICLFAGAGLTDRYIKETGPSFVAAVIAATLVDLANADRVDAALHDLTVNPKLVAAAQAKANDMAQKGYFAHISPDGQNSWHWFESVGYGYAYAGENLAVDFSESADVEEAWMNSPTHRDNILHRQYTEIGIAVAHGTYKGRPAVFAVQMFGRPSAAELRSRTWAKESAVMSTTSPWTFPGAGSAQVLGEISIGAQDFPPYDESAGRAQAFPWWASFVAEPSKTFRYAYYIIGLLVLAALFFDMELELKWHHFRHARKAGILLATMSMLFIAADWLFFAEPTLAAIGKFIQ